LYVIIKKKLQLFFRCSVIKSKRAMRTRSLLTRRFRAVLARCSGHLTETFRSAFVRDVGGCTRRSCSGIQLPFLRCLLLKTGVELLNRFTFLWLTFLRKESLFGLCYFSQENKCLIKYPKRNVNGNYKYLLTTAFS